MQNNTSENGVLKDGIRDIQQAYMARFPDKTTELLNSKDIEHIKAMLAITSSDSKYIVSIIAKMNKTASGEVPGWAYINTVVKREYDKKIKPINAKTKEELFAMCDFSIKQQMYENITQAIIEDTIPADELPIKSWDDPNIKKILNALYEDERINDEMFQDGIRGHELLCGELKEFGDLITSGKVKDIIPD